MLEAKNISHWYKEKIVLENVSFALEPASLIGLIGPSGSGKSVLLKILAGLFKPKAGSVVGNICERGDVALMFQEGALFDSLSLYDNVAFPLVGGRVPTSILDPQQRNRVHSQVQEMLARVGLSKAAYKMPGQLSGGMRRRASLARALVGKPKILLLDDPTSGLDPIASSIIMELIVNLYNEYKPTTIMVSHDLRRLIPSVKKILTLFSGRVPFYGTLQELKSSNHSEIIKFVSCRYDLLTQ